MTRFKLTVEYDGRQFVGWQRQDSGMSVQQALEEAIFKFCGEGAYVQGAGRTDAGVHALGQVAHFDCAVERPLGAWVRGVNALLPPAVAVTWAQPVAADFHARFSAGTSEAPSQAKENWQRFRQVWF